MFGKSKKEKEEAQTEEVLATVEEEAVTESSKVVLDDESKLYELSFNIVPTLTEAAVSDEFEKIKADVVKRGGKIVSDSSPALINLAYTMDKTIDAKKQKFNSAYFGWIRFTAEATTPILIKEDLDNMVTVIRHLLVVAHVEGEISAEKVSEMINKSGDESNKKDSRKKKKVVAEEEVEDASEEKKEEEIDEAIDELVSDGE